jgi:mannosyl-glycoprotein endo-beta-N-acetylglucosaminidase
LTTSTSTSTTATVAAPPQFTAADRYFRVTDDLVPVYDSSSGTQKQIGYLQKGQVYPRVADVGDWHQIKFGNGYGYVLKASTIPADGSSITDLNSGLSNSSQYFIPTQLLTVYDNSTGSLVPFASLQLGVQYPIISDQGNMYEVDVAGRIGYVYKSGTKLPFKSSDRYFSVYSDNVSVYDNSSGSLKFVGTLAKGQIYPRISGGDWQQIKFGNGYGYVWADSTAPASETTLKNVDPGMANSGRTFTANTTLTVYDNSSGSLIPFANLAQGVQYPYISDTGDWLLVDVAGRLGYVYKAATTIGFLPSDQYFQANQDNVSIYDNSSGSLKFVGILAKGQIFPRVSGGDWQQIKFGNGFGYVWAAATVPTTGNTLKNLNPGMSNSSRTFKPNTIVTVYDNSNGSLVPFVNLDKGVQYPIISDTGDWLLIDVGGRVGYVYKAATTESFLASDRYFQANQDSVTVYDNSSGSLQVVGHLAKGEIYPRIADYGSDWHQIKFGNGYGYVWKDATNPANGNVIKDLNTNLQNSKIFMVPKQDIAVYDNTSGSLVPFASLVQGKPYPVISDFGGDWYKVDVSGRIGYVYKPGVQVGPIYNYTSYNLTLDQMLAKQLSVYNATDKNYNVYVRSDALIVNDANNPTSGTAVAASMSVRGGPGASYWTVGTLNNQEQVTILNKVYNSQDGYWWYQINFNRTWVTPNPVDVKYYLNPGSFSSNSDDYYQFLSLSKPAGVNVQEVNDRILAGKGILTGEAAAFVSAANSYNVNEIYLISHALLETGGGKSQLATGVLVTQVNGVPVSPKTVYNMYGIHAYDSSPTQSASEYAYTQNWFTPEAAIIGGAKWISDNYIHDLTDQQDTLYKMRFNPAFPATYNYASDIAWADKQTPYISSLYKLLSSFVLTYDVPVYAL